MTDEELATLCLDADAPARAAFEELYRRHKADLFSYFLRRTGDREWASELFQDVWLRAHRYRRSYDPKQPWRIWLFWMARNLLRNHRRQAGLRASVVKYFEPEQIDRVSDPRRDLHALVRARDDLRSVQRVLRDLPAHQGEAIILAKYHGFTHREIAEILNKSEPAVRSLISRGLLELRRALAGGDSELEGRAEPRPVTARGTG